MILGGAFRRHLYNLRKGQLSRAFEDLGPDGLVPQTHDQLVSDEEVCLRPKLAVEAEVRQGLGKVSYAFTVPLVPGVEGVPRVEACLSSGSHVKHATTAGKRN